MYSETDTRTQQIGHYCLHHLNTEICFQANQKLSKHYFLGRQNKFISKVHLMKLLSRFIFAGGDWGLGVDIIYYICHTALISFQYIPNVSKCKDVNVPNDPHASAWRCPSLP